MAEKVPMDPFFERSLIGRSPEEKAEARKHRDDRLVRAAQELAEQTDQDQGEQDG